MNICYYVQGLLYFQSHLKNLQCVPGLTSDALVLSQLLSLDVDEQKHLNELQRSLLLHTILWWLPTSAALDKTCFKLASLNQNGHCRENVHITAVYEWAALWRTDYCWHGVIFRAGNSAFFMFLWRQRCFWLCRVSGFFENREIYSF